MRTSKFRGKQYKTGEWLEGDLIHLHHDVMILPLDANWFDFVPRKDNPLQLPSDKFVVDKETVGQFTNLFDKSRNEIYEGDIIRDGEFIRVILWATEAAAFCSCSPYHSDIKTRTSADEMRFYEVIGNIHDNPELIKKEGNDESDVH